MDNPMPDRQYCWPKQIISELSDEEKKIIVDGGAASPELLKNLEALGLVMNTPKFWWMTQLGDFVKDLIVNKREMTTTEAEAYRAGLKDGKALAIKAVDEEPELPGDPPEKTLKAILENPAVALRGTVIATKRHIRQRIEMIQTDDGAP
jgi:hypothetical protein